MAGGSFFGSSSSARVRTGTHARSGRLPLVQCPFYQTTVVKHTSQTSSNSGKKLFKCPKNENLPNQYKIFMWGDKYETYLVDNGLLHVDNPSLDDAITGLPATAASMEATLYELKFAINEVQETMEEMKKFMTDMQGAIVAMPPVLTAIRNIMNGMHGEMKGLRFGMAGNVALVNKNNRLGERLMIVAWLIAFLLVAILAVFLKK